MNLPFYRVSRSLCRLVIRLVYGFRSVQSENVPATGAVIVACNHVSYLDPVVLGIGFARPVTYLAKKELFAIPVLGPIITGLGVHPVDRQAGGVAAVRAALRALKDGRCIGIFPEGTRNLTGDVEGKGRRGALGCAFRSPGGAGRDHRDASRAALSSNTRDLRRADPRRTEAESGRRRFGEVDRRDHAPYPGARGVDRW